MLVGELLFSMHPSLSCAIMEEPVPPHFKVLTLEICDGPIDSYNHIESFKALMMLHKVLDALMYKSFLTTFKDVVELGIPGSS